MLQHETLDSKNLIKRLDNDIFFDEFIFSIRPIVTELFRDPDMWSVLLKDILPKLLKKEKTRIYVPQCSSGDELYSLLVLLDQLNGLEAVEIFVDEISDKHIEKTKTGIFPNKKLEISAKNYEVLGLQTPFSHYITSKDASFVMKSTLKGKTIFNPTGWFDIEDQENFDLIIFRNNLIYYNSELQQTIIQVLTEKLNKSGFLIIGIKEKLSKLSLAKYSVYNKTENIFRKNTTGLKWIR